MLYGPTGTFRTYPGSSEIEAFHGNLPHRTTFPLLSLQGALRCALACDAVCRCARADNAGVAADQDPLAPSEHRSQEDVEGESFHLSFLGRELGFALTPRFSARELSEQFIAQHGLPREHTRALRDVIENHVAEAIEGRIEEGMLGNDAEVGE